MGKHRRLLILCLVGILIPARSLLGQSTNAAITGQVTDPLKAVIVQAKVTAVNNNTNVRYEGTTNQTGSYLIPSVPPGDYRIEVEKTGFKTIVKPDVILHVQDTIELNFEMALGSASETVTVTGGASMINTTDASVSTVVLASLIGDAVLELIDSDVGPGGDDAQAGHLGGAVPAGRQGEDASQNDPVARRHGLLATPRLSPNRVNARRG